MPKKKPGPGAKRKFDKWSKMTVSLDESMRDDLDEYCADHGQKRSAVVRQGIEAVIYEEQE